MPPKPEQLPQLEAELARLKQEALSLALDAERLENALLAGEVQPDRFLWAHHDIKRQELRISYEIGVAAARIDDLRGLMRDREDRPARAADRQEQQERPAEAESPRTSSAALDWLRARQDPDAPAPRDSELDREPDRERDR